ncbi:MAG: 2-oxoacid:acceptor oxidoreductase family protein [Archaeoglobus sp.]|nr:2-oxoacid:acceptor oxidoreductase family protein [Archaeoglobus sp.]
MEGLNHAHHNDELNIRIAGRGGQGIIKLGLFLAEASVLEGKNVVQTQSYGPEARGGACRTDLIISNGEIDYPGLRRIDVFLVLDQEAYLKYSPILDEKSIVIYDSDLVKPDRAKHIAIGFPFTKKAIEDFGNPIFANIIAFGALVAITKIIKPETALYVLKKRLKKFQEENLNAFVEGYELALITPKAVA